MTAPQPRDGRPQPRGPVLHDALDPEFVPDLAGPPMTPGAGHTIEPAGTPEGPPWDSGDRPPAGPAPIIETDSPLPPGPVKPLGPRRLARLQREMAEHQRQVEEAERRNAGRVDEDLLLKQQRFAELAVRAAAANEQDRSDAEAAVRAAQSSQSSPGTEPSGTGQRHDPQSDPAGERIEVVFPRTPAGGSALSLDPVQADPGRLASSSLAPHMGPETTQLHLFTGVVPVSAETQVPPAAGPGVAEDTVEPEVEPEVEAPDDRQPVASPALAEPAAAPAEAQPAPAEPELAASSAGPVESEATPADPQPGAPSSTEPNEPEATPAGPVAAPAAPVRALDAEGLELLEPRDYKQRPGALVPLLLLLAVVLAALLVVLIVFVL